MATEDDHAPLAVRPGDDVDKHGEVATADTEEAVAADNEDGHGDFVGALLNDEERSAGVADE